MTPDLRSSLRRFRRELIGVAVIAAATLPFRDGWMGFLILLVAVAVVWSQGFRHLKRYKDELAKAAADAERSKSEAAAQEVSQLVREVMAERAPVPAAPVLSLVNR